MTSDWRFLAGFYSHSIVSRRPEHGGSLDVTCVTGVTFELTQMVCHPPAEPAMTTASPSKQSRSAKSRRSKHADVSGNPPLPLVVDPRDLSVMNVEPLDPEDAEQLFIDLYAQAGQVSQARKKKRPADRSGPGMVVIYDIAGRGKRVKVGPQDETMSPPLDEALVRFVFKQTLESVKEVHQNGPGQLTTDQFIRQVAQTLADKADAGPQQVSVEQGWQALLESGLKSKTSLLKSAEFKTTSEASELLGIREAAVRKRIREQKLFALKTPVDGAHRIPAWALDPNISGGPTAALLAEAKAADEWHMYHFLSTPNGSLNGLRPFECLLSSANLPLSRLAIRDELIVYLGLSGGASLLETVRQAWSVELAEGRKERQAKGRET